MPGYAVVALSSAPPKNGQMLRISIWAVVVSSMLAACGGSGSSTGELGSNAGTLWLQHRYSASVVALDLANPTPFTLGIMFPGEINAIAVDDQFLWAGSENGTLYRSNFSGDTIEELVIGQPIISLTLAGGKVWVANEGVPGGPTNEDLVGIAVVDAATFARTADLTIGSIADNYEMLASDGDFVYVLIGNGFALAKVNAATNEIVAQVDLGEDPDDVEGPRGSFYGYGEIVVGSDAVWVLDDYNHRVLKLAKSDLAFDAWIDLESFVPGGDTQHITLADSGLFVGASDTPGFVAIDPASSMVTGTVDVAAAATSRLTARGSLIAFAPLDPGATIWVVDTDSGNTVFESFGQADQIVWGDPIP